MLFFVAAVNIYFFSLPPALACFDISSALTYFFSWWRPATLSRWSNETALQTYWDGGLTGANFTPRGRAAVSFACSFAVLSADRKSLVNNNGTLEYASTRLPLSTSPSGSCSGGSDSDSGSGSDSGGGAVLFVAGVGPAIDVFTNPSVASATLRLA